METRNNVTLIDCQLIAANQNGWYKQTKISKLNKQNKQINKKSILVDQHLLPKEAAGEAPPSLIAWGE